MSVPKNFPRSCKSAALVTFLIEMTDCSLVQYKSFDADCGFLLTVDIKIELSLGYARVISRPCIKSAIVFSLNKRGAFLSASSISKFDLKRINREFAADARGLPRCMNVQSRSENHENIAFELSLQIATVFIIF